VTVTCLCLRDNGTAETSVRYVTYIAAAAPHFVSWGAAGVRSSAPSQRTTTPITTLHTDLFTLLRLLKRLAFVLVSAVLGSTNSDGAIGGGKREAALSHKFIIITLRFGEAR